MKYGLNDKPPLLPMMLYGLQWLLVSIPCVVILGLIVSKIHLTDAVEQTFYMQKLFGLMGVALIIQVLWGHRLPLVIGPASVLLIGVLASVSSGMEAVYTSIMVCGALLAIAAFCGLLSKLQFIFTPRIITVILCLIAFTLSPIILKLIFGDTIHTLFNLFFALLLAFAMFIANQLLRGVWKSTVVLLAMGAGSLIYFLANGNTPVPAVSTEYSGTLSLFSFSPDFEFGTILSFLFCFIALLVNELGSIQAVGRMLRADQLEQRTTRGVGIIGLSNVLAGFLGIVGPVDYSMSPGVISATGCASRYTLIPAGAGLIICAFFPGLIHLLSVIPGVVMGTILLYLMASQLSAAMQMLVREKAITDFNSGITVGFPLMIALLLSFAPPEAINHIPALIRPIIGNGFVMGVISVLLLEHLIFKTRKDDSNS